MYCSQRPTLGLICGSVMCGSLLYPILHYFWTQNNVINRQLVSTKEELRRERSNGKDLRREISIVSIEILKLQMRLMEFHCMQVNEQN